MCVCMAHSLLTGVHILPSSLFLIDHNLCVGSGVVYLTFINETLGVPRGLGGVWTPRKFLGTKRRHTWSNVTPLLPRETPWSPSTTQQRSTTSTSGSPVLGSGPWRGGYCHGFARLQRYSLTTIPITRVLITRTCSSLPRHYLKTRHFELYFLFCLDLLDKKVCSWGCIYANNFI